MYCTSVLRSITFSEKEKYFCLGSNQRYSELQSENSRELGRAFIVHKTRILKEIL
jgi:hypothetical protein